jgi:hypothetical protein
VDAGSDAAAEAGADAGSDAGSGGPDAGSDSGPPGPTFTADVHPLFKMYCGGCHTGSGFGGHNMGASNVNAAYTDSQSASNSCAGKTKGACAGIRVRNGEMPPGGFPDLQGRQEIANTIDAWVAAGQKK